MAPTIKNLAKGCEAPKTFKDGLTGGIGVNSSGQRSEGGFGGGGAEYWRSINEKYKYTQGKYKKYWGAGGGFSGGCTKTETIPWGMENGEPCWISKVVGGGGGSFSADPNAKFDHHYVEYGYCEIKMME